MGRQPSLAFVMPGDQSQVQAKVRFIIRQTQVLDCASAAYLKTDICRVLKLALRKCNNVESCQLVTNYNWWKMVKNLQTLTVKDEVQPIESLSKARSHLSRDGWDRYRRQYQYRWQQHQINSAEDHFWSTSLSTLTNFVTDALLVLIEFVEFYDMTQCIKN